MCLDKSNRPSGKEHYWLSPSKDPFVLGERDFMDYFVFIDEEVLRQEGITDFAPYAVDPKGKLMTDLFVAGCGEGQ